MMKRTETYSTSPSFALPQLVLTPFQTISDPFSDTRGQCLSTHCCVWGWVGPCAATWCSGCVHRSPQLATAASESVIVETPQAPFRNFLAGFDSDIKQAGFGGKTVNLRSSEYFIITGVRMLSCRLFSELQHGYGNCHGTK